MGEESTQVEAARFYANHQPQSSELSSRDAFLEGMQEVDDKFDGTSEIPFQNIAVGLILRPESIEEWRGSVADRLHERMEHRKKDDGTWESVPLVP